LRGGICKTKYNNSKKGSKNGSQALHRMFRVFLCRIINENEFPPLERERVAIHL